MDSLLVWCEHSQQTGLSLTQIRTKDDPEEWPDSCPGSIGLAAAQGCSSSSHTEGPCREHLWTLGKWGKDFFCSLRCKPECKSAVIWFQPFKILSISLFPVFKTIYSKGKRFSECLSKMKGVFCRTVHSFEHLWVHALKSKCGSVFVQAIYTPSELRAELMFHLRLQ